MEDKISLTLVPAKEEISEYSGTNKYWCGLELTEQSVIKLVNDMQNEFLSDSTTDHEDWPLLSLIRRKSAGFEPEMIFKLAVTILSGTVSVAFFKLLKLWIQERNGRKVRVRLPNGFEVETSQLSHKEFCKLFADLHSTYATELDEAPKGNSKSKCKMTEKMLLKTIKKRKLTVLDRDNVLVEIVDLNKIYRKKARELRRK